MPRVAPIGAPPRSADVERPDRSCSGPREASQIARRRGCYPGRMKLRLPSHLSDDALVAEVARLACSERETVGVLLVHLSELDRRRLYLPAGYSSLYKYCRGALRLSEFESVVHIKAARALRRCPHILDMLRDGTLNMTTLRLLLPHLTPVNQHELLAEASGRSRTQVQELLARLFPKDDVPPSIRPIPTAAPVVDPAPPVVHVGMEGATPFALAGHREPVPPTPRSERSTAPPTVAARPLVTPRAADRYQVTFTASGKTVDKLELARDLLRHAIPDGDPAAIMDRALTAPPGAARPREVRRDRSAAAGAKGAGRHAIHPGRGPARGVAAGPRPVHVRREGRAPLRRARLPRVPPHRSVRGRREGDGREPDPQVFIPQPA